MVISNAKSESLVQRIRHASAQKVYKTQQAAVDDPNRRSLINQGIKAKLPGHLADTRGVRTLSRRVMPGIRIGQLLVEQGVISDTQVQHILKIQKESGRPFGDLAE